MNAQDSIPLSDAGSPIRTTLIRHASKVYDDEGSLSEIYDVIDDKVNRDSFSDDLTEFIANEICDLSNGHSFVSEAAIDCANALNRAARQLQAVADRMGELAGGRRGEEELE